mmetsp:Transcript_76115/g.168125  ORF Transcript_76115/g.168125 Transcript_76115/m.168125 type:complete len:90 (+) Transcript_76115:420-689(+)
MQVMDGCVLTHRPRRRSSRVPQAHTAPQQATLYPDRRSLVNAGPDQPLLDASIPGKLGQLVFPGPALSPSKGEDDLLTACPDRLPNATS